MLPRLKRILALADAIDDQIPADETAVTDANLDIITSLTDEIKTLTVEIEDIIILTSKTNSDGPALPQEEYDK